MKKLLLLVSALSIALCITIPCYAGQIFSDPTGVSSNNWENGTWSNVDNGIRQPDVNGITLDSMDDGLTGVAVFNMSNVVMGTDLTTAILVWIYAKGEGGGDDIEGDLNIAGGFEGQSAFSITASNSWKSLTFTGSWTDTQVDAMTVEVTAAPGFDRVTLFECYAEINTVSSGNSVTINDRTSLMSNSELSLSRVKKGANL